MWLVPILILFVGCKSTEKGKGTDASNATATADNGGKGKHWLDGPSPDWAKGDVPKAGSWADPRDPKFDYTNYVKGALAGYVLDISEKPAPNAIISVEPADPAGKAAQPMVVLADGTGAFVVHGLKPSETYALTAKLKDGSNVYVGQTFAMPPSVHVRIRLKDQMTLPNAPGFGRFEGVPSATAPNGTIVPRPRSAGDLPPTPGSASELPSPAPLARDGSIPPREGRSPNDNSWSPIPPPGSTGTPGTTGTSPSNIPPLSPAPNSTPPSTAGTPDGVLPPPSATFPGTGGSPSRPELNTTGPQPEWKPPAANVPSPKFVPPPTIAPPPLPSDSKPPAESKPSSTSKKQSFILLDPTGRSVEMPNNQPGELILLDFMTTSCVPCKKAVPELIEFQRRYGANGVELVGVVCDESSETDRRTAASSYARTYGLNYLLYTEAKAKEIRKQFGVDRYPTLVLVDSTGSVLWTGHPKDMRQLEQVVRAELQKR
ncbi:MAG: thioredoxin-like domain-containing protein [Gemmataceae bacterium]